MFKIRLVKSLLPDYIFLLANGFLVGVTLKDIYPYDKVSAIFIITLVVICFLAYIWKFSITSIKEESMDSDKIPAK